MLCSYCYQYLHMVGIGSLSPSLKEEGCQEPYCSYREQDRACDRLPHCEGYDSEDKRSYGGQMQGACELHVYPPNILRHQGRSAPS